MSINKQRIQQIKGPTNKRAQRGELIDRRSDKHAYRQTNKLTDWQTNTDKQKQRLTKQRHGPRWSALAYMKKNIKRW